MYVLLRSESDRQPTLEEADDFKSFKVVAPAVLAGGLDDALGDLGWVAEDEDHVFLRVEAVRAIAGRGADEEWGKQFDGMISYADDKGWLDPTGTAIQAHVETRD